MQLTQIWQSLTDSLFHIHKQNNVVTDEMWLKWGIQYWYSFLNYTWLKSELLQLTCTSKSRHLLLFVLTNFRTSLAFSSIASSTIFSIQTGSLNVRIHPLASTTSFRSLNFSSLSRMSSPVKNYWSGKLL